MQYIFSSFFGRLFGHSTKIFISETTLIVTVNGKTTEIKWQDLRTPPQFTLRLFGQSLTFSTSTQDYVLSKLAYNCIKKQKLLCEQYWSAVHVERLEKLLIKIDSFTANCYLRDSTVKRIERVVKTEYSRWFPWVESSQVLNESTELVQLLYNYHHWQLSDINDFRESYISKQLIAHKLFFDRVETNPLTLKQRRACIIDDDNNLLLAGAGTGKTSVMVGRAGYLVNSQQAKDHELLLLAYGKIAADEMDQRLKEKLTTQVINATTFHRLGLTIIKQVEMQDQIISVFAEDEKSKNSWINRCFTQLIEEHESYLTSVLNYFRNHYYTPKQHEDFDNLGDYYQYLNDNNVRSFKDEKVNSFAELTVANWLFEHAINYQYHGSYVVDVKNAKGLIYQPTFFLTDLNIYIDYFYIDKNGDSASDINKQDYRADMYWKKQVHQQHSTDYIVLNYADFNQGKILSLLAKSLFQRQVVLTEISNQSLLTHLKENGRFKTLVETLASLISLYKGACLDEGSESKLIKGAENTQQMQQALILLKPLLNAYQQQLENNNEIDFEDMINKALFYIESGQFVSPWRYIMVDEFQDISEPRARLVKALRDNHKGCSVFAVGDDWQAIYRFSGADVTLTTSFKDYFGATAKNSLDTTFRFNDRIGQVATRFISKNPDQISKKINSFVQVSEPAISILMKNNPATEKHVTQTVSEIQNGALDDVLMAISKQVNKAVSVYLLARYWFLLPNKTMLTELNKRYPQLMIKNQTFHASKGKEADYVVIVGLHSGHQGFPSERTIPAVIDVLLAKRETFKHAEERRLFYVALTRAKHRVYLIANKQQPSEFVQELINDGDVKMNEFGTVEKPAIETNMHCTVCITGSLKPRVGQNSVFYSCSNFPRCKHKESACKLCASLMNKLRSEDFKHCSNITCGELIPVCDQCGADMMLRIGVKGEFWGCKNYQGNNDNSCKNSFDSSKIKWPKLNR